MSKRLKIAVGILAALAVLLVVAVVPMMFMAGSAPPPVSSGAAPEPTDTYSPPPYPSTAAAEPQPEQPSVGGGSGPSDGAVAPAPTRPIEETPCSLCPTEVVLDADRAICFLEMVSDAAPAEGMTVIDLSECETSRGVVEAMPSPNAGGVEPDTKFMLSGSQLTCLKAKLEEPGLVLDPIATIDLADCLAATGAPSDGAGGSVSAPLARHPMVDAPDKVVAAEVFTVSIGLTAEQFTPEAVASPAQGEELDPSGALRLNLPATMDEWPIDVDLVATGFELADGGKWTRRFTLYRSGDSDVVRFEIKARKSASAKPRQLNARFYHAGNFLGSAARPIEVYPDADALTASESASGVSLMAATEPPALSSDVLIGDAVQVPDMDVLVHYDDPDNLGSGFISIHSPHLGGPVSEEFTTPVGMTAWLESEYGRLVQLGLQVRGATSLTATATATDPEAQKRFVTKVAEGFGADLYRNYVPQPFKDVLSTLRSRDKLHSIQITSNSPVLPWEILIPDGSGGSPQGFLGIDYRVARWAPRDTVGQIDRPLNRLSFSGVTAVAPAYDGSSELPFQKVEVDALSKLTGFRLAGGDFSSFEKLVGETSTGFIHFSGHGEVNSMGTGAPVFAIRLTDQALDPNTWRALTFAPHDKGNPFYFFNACDSGRAASLGGFVQGWGPAVLSSGASGFIGGMWPLTDRTAADFSSGFYKDIAERVSGGPVYLAEVLQGLRRRFYETGDPTYLAYTFYGNTNLQVVVK